MKKIILTSAGFENKSIEHKFLEMVCKASTEIKALWIPTAAIDDNAKAMLPKCMDDLLNAGLLPENITTYDLDRVMSLEEISTYDAIYVCGGNSKYLLSKMYKAKFIYLLNSFIDNGGIYIGVSAGSCICADGLKNNLEFMPCELSVHCSEGSPSGDIDFDQCSHIMLTDNQAIIIEDDKCYIMG